MARGACAVAPVAPGCRARAVDHSSARKASAAGASAASRSLRTCRRGPRCPNAAGPASEVGGGLNPDLRKQIDELIAAHKIVVFMKGNKFFPQCGFSNTVVQILTMSNAQFHDVNILENEALRSGMKEYSQWPTFPQVYIDGEFYGGCDIMIGAYQSGELQETLERALNS